MTTVFISSFVALVVMIMAKLIEERFGFLLWSKFVSWADEKIHEWIHVLVKRYQLWKKIAYLFFFEFLPSYAYELLIKMKDYVQKRYYESQSKLKGNKRMLRPNGSVSSFLQEIADTEPVVTKQESVEKQEEKELKKEE
jgi:hypothetical protein